MRYLTAGTLAACIAAAAAFKDTSPFALLSTSESSYSDHPAAKQYRASTDILENTKSFLKSCPSKTYVLVSQPATNVDDFLHPKTHLNLDRAISNENVRTKITASDVIGAVSPDDVQEYIISRCDALAVKVDPSVVVKRPVGSKPVIYRLDLHALSGPLSLRLEKLIKHDAILQSVLDETLSSEGYTIIYTTTPPSNNVKHTTHPYEPVFVEPLHMDLKRRFDDELTASNKTAKDRRPLFEKYQFFTPGLFMGLLVAFLLLAILSVAISAVASLQVSYGAFEKEMGPSAQKQQ